MAKDRNQSRRTEAGPSGENPIQADEGARLRTGGRLRRWMFRTGATVGVPLLVLALVEAVLRLAGYGYDPHFFIPWTIQGEPFLVQNEDFSRRFFPPETLRHAGALRMRADKPAGSIRVFILGESAAMGDPEPTYGPSRYLEALLWQRHPDIDFEVVNVAFTAINSHVILPIARECAAQEGDIWILYMGNNEMVGPFGAVTVFGRQSPPRPWIRLSLAVQRTRLGQLGMSLSRQYRGRPTDVASWGGMQMFLQKRISPKSPKREIVYQNFDKNLEAILSCGLRSGAAILLNTVAVNLRDSPPFASVNDGELSRSELARFTRVFEAAREAQGKGNDAQAAEQFAEACELDPGHAEAHYRQAMCLDRSGQIERAHVQYQSACDTDALPFRTDSRLNASIRQAAARHRGDRLVLLETPARLAEENPAGVCGNETFYEHVHFNFNGAYRLGLAWAQAVEGLIPTGSAGRSTNAWASRAACDQRLALTDWNRRLVLQSVIRRLREPPLSTQFVNRDRLQQLRQLEQHLRSRAKAATVASAHEVYVHAIASRPSDHYLHESFAAFLQSTGDLAGAIEEWRRVSQLIPHDFLPWFQLGSLLVKQGDHTEGQAFLRKSLSLRPRLILGWSELGQSLGAQEKWEPAIEAFERAGQLQPGDPALWAYKAKALAGAGRREEAIAAYRRAVELRPDYWEAHGALGDLYSEADRLSEAVAQYKAVIRAKPEDVTAQFNLGVMFVRQGHLEEGIRQFQQTLELDPDHEHAREYLAKVQRLVYERRSQDNGSVEP